MTGTSRNQANRRRLRATRPPATVDRECIRAHLNLFAVLQNLEELVRLDGPSAKIVRTADVSVQFRVRRGPWARLEFRDGQCRHERGRRASADILLCFLSPRHLNAMFDGNAKPIPMRGFTKLGWLQSEFTQLTDRLVHVLDPTDDASRKSLESLRATLLLQTGLYGAAELAVLEPTCRRIAARMADSVLAVEVLPDGPHIHAVISNGQFRTVKARAENPLAKITIRNASVATALLENQLDSFEALATGDLQLAGQIAVLDDFLLILDRVAHYITPTA